MIWTPPPADAAEIAEELSRAKRHLEEDEHEWHPANYFKLIAGDFESLKLYGAEAHRAAIRTALAEVGVEHSTPPELPGTSNEPVCRGAVMRAFCWESTHFRQRMYFKFGWHKGHLFIFSLHQADFERSQRQSKSSQKRGRR